MFWYIIHVRHNMGESLVDCLNRNSHLKAFIPKIEKWYSASHIRNYLIQDLYSDYVFIKTSLNKEEFYKTYKDFLLSIDSIANMVDHDEVYALNNEEQLLMEKLFNQKSVIEHSIGNIVNSQLIVESGPLMNLEDKVIKIDRHKRTATLKNSFFNETFKVPLEVISKT